jgi:glutamine amidotransferase
MIAIVDYGMGNLRSVQKGLEKAGFEAKITSAPEVVKKASGVVLPGVGAFAECMLNLEKSGLKKVVNESVFSGKPFLGICLGYQLLFSYSEENGIHKGLGVIEGKVIRLPEKVKIPHMGWNSIIKERETPILDGIPDNSYFYFVHSYYPLPENSQIITTITEYGLDFASSITYNNIFGMQFHPEKSGSLGLKVLENFGRWVNDYSTGG